MLRELELSALLRQSAGRGRHVPEQPTGRLLVFLDEPRVLLGNNAAERCVRGPVVGRKNFAGCESVRGTEVTAAFYMLVESARRGAVEPRAYLRAASEAALTGGRTLLPNVYRGPLRTERAPCEVPRLAADPVSYFLIDMLRFGCLLTAACNASRTGDTLASLGGDGTVAHVRHGAAC